MEPVNVDAMLSRFAEHWSPKRIARLNNYDIRIVKVQGEFTWHTHPDTDEFFLVFDGQPGWPQPGRPGMRKAYPSPSSRRPRPRPGQVAGGRRRQCVSGCLA
jgi:hypothetical protein